MPDQAQYDFILKIAKQYGLNTFVETGTLVGETSAWAARVFETVYTIELDKRYYNDALQKFAAKGIQNVKPHLGDSRTILSKILGKMREDERALIFLDAHWGPDLHYDRPETGECPLLDELRSIMGMLHIMMIHDARYIVGKPAGKHDPSQWPTLAEVEEIATERGYNVTVINELDVILLVPKGQGA